jgi:hypothetical protein
MLYLAIAIVVFVFAVFVVIRKRAPGSPTARSAPVAAPSVAKLPKRHLIVNPTTTFESLARSLRATGFSLTDPAEVTGEPLAATWDAGAGAVHYTYEPEIGLRKLEVVAPSSACPSIIDDIVNGSAYVSTIDHQLPSYLDPDKSVNELLFGIRGAEWRGRGEDHRFYWEKVGTLRNHPDPRVASEARRVFDCLVAEAGGKPIPSGPRGLQIAWTKAGATYVAQQQGRTWVYTPADGTLMIGADKFDEKITEWPERWAR